VLTCAVVRLAIQCIAQA